MVSSLLERIMTMAAILIGGRKIEPQKRKTGGRGGDGVAQGMM
jgi:hypothetical protein